MRLLDSINIIAKVMELILGCCHLPDITMSKLRLAVIHYASSSLIHRLPEWVEKVQQPL
jgi:hypothetical protein